MKAKILSCGGYLPKVLMTNEELSKKVETNDEWIRSRTGITQRYLAIEETTTDMALQASLIALKGVEKIDGIIFGTSTPDLAFPSAACILQRKLAENGIKAGFGIDVSAACAGFVYGLSIANAFIKNGTYKTLLVVGADIVSKALDWNDRTTAVLFGDGAGAVLLGATEENDVSGIIDTDMESDGSLGEILRTTEGLWRDDDKPIRIKMQGQEVFKNAVVKVSESIEKLLLKNKIKKEDVAFVVPHQANVRILDALSERLSIPREKFVMTVDKHANTSAASIPLAIWESTKENKFKKGDLLVLEGFGGGFTWAGALLRW